MDHWGPCQKLPATPRLKYLSTSHEPFPVRGKILFRPESGLALIIELTRYLISPQAQGVLYWMQPKRAKETEAWRGDKPLPFSERLCAKNCMGCLQTFM